MREENIVTISDYLRSGFSGHTVRDENIGYDHLFLIMEKDEREIYRLQVSEDILSDIPPLETEEMLERFDVVGHMRCNELKTVILNYSGLEGEDHKPLVIDLPPEEATFPPVEDHRPLVTDPPPEETTFPPVEELLGGRRMARYCPNPECIGYRHTGASAQFGDHETNCTLCASTLVNESGDPVTPREYLEDKLAYYTRLRFLVKVLLIVTLVAISLGGRLLDHLFDWEPGATASLIVAAAILAILFQAFRLLVMHRALRRRRTPGDESDPLDGTGPLLGLEDSDPFDFFDFGGGDGGGGE